MLRREEDNYIMRQEEEARKMDRVRRRQEAFTNPGFPWFVGFERLTLDELNDIRCDLLERLDEPELLRDGDDDAYALWIKQINDEILRRADELLATYNETMKVYRGES